MAQEPKTRGFKSSVSHEKRLAVIQKYDILSNGKVKTESDQIWVDICIELNIENEGKQMNPKNIHTYVSQNRRNILTDFKKLSSQEKGRSVDFIKESEPRNDETENKLITLQNDALYQPCIREISTSPFSIFHWTIEAVDFVSKLPLTPPFIFGAVDVFCKKFTGPDGKKSNDIMLHVFGPILSEEFLSVGHLSAEESNKHIFTRFFREIIRSGLKLPHVIKVDHFWNSFLSANEVFNVNLPFEEYIKLTFNYMIGKSQEVPRCLILMDNKFCILSILECIKNVPLESIRRFYIQCIVLLSYQDNIYDFQDVLYNIFLFSYNKFQTHTSRKSFRLLMDKINKADINMNYSKKEIAKLEADLNVSNNENKYNLNITGCNDVEDYIKTVFVKAREEIVESQISDQNLELNAFYNESFCSKLIELCITFTIWTNIMSVDLKINLELNLTTYGEHLKNYLGAKTTVDVYLMKSIDFSNEILQKQMKKIPTQLKKKTEKTKGDTHSHIFLEEDWKGKNKKTETIRDSVSSLSESSKSSDTDTDSSDDFNRDLIHLQVPVREVVDSICEERETEGNCSRIGIINSPVLQNQNKSRNSEINDSIVTTKEDIRKKQRGKHLRPCEYIDLQEQKPSNKIVKRRVIKNINNNKPKIINKKKVVFATSSIFDSIFEVLVSACLSIKHFQDYVQNDEEEWPYKAILKKYLQKMKLSAVNADRTEFLSKVCIEQNGKLCWTKTLGEFFDKFVGVNIFVNLTCNLCKAHHFQLFSRLQITDVEQLNCLENDEEFCNYLNLMLTCEKCNAKSLHLEKYQIGNILCIDVEKREDKKINLDSVKVNMEIGTQNFTLIGVIAFKEPIGVIRLRHYIGYCRTFQGSWNKFDDADNIRNLPKLVNKEDLSVNVALLLYFKYLLPHDDRKK